MALKGTESLEFEFLQQVATFTLKKDLNLPEWQIQAFEAHFKKNVDLFAEKVIEKEQIEIQRRKEKEADLMAAAYRQRQEAIKST